MRAQALIILATFASLAGVAIAEETVETTDGRLILLRDDGRYEILPAGTLALPACKPAEGYTERDVLAVERDQQQLIEQHRKVCDHRRRHRRRAGNRRARCRFHHRAAFGATKSSAGFNHRYRDRS